MSNEEDMGLATVGCEPNGGLQARTSGSHGNYGVVPWVPRLVPSGSSSAIDALAPIHYGPEERSGSLANLNRKIVVGVGENILVLFVLTVEDDALNFS